MNWSIMFMNVEFSNWITIGGYGNGSINIFTSFVIHWFILLSFKTISKDCLELKWSTKMIKRIESLVGVNSSKWWSQRLLKGYLEQFWCYHVMLIFTRAMIALKWVSLNLEHGFLTNSDVHIVTWFNHSTKIHVKNCVLQWSLHEESEWFTEWEGKTQCITEKRVQNESFHKWAQDLTYKLSNDIPFISQLNSLNGNEIYWWGLGEGAISSSNRKQCSLPSHFRNQFD
jgi:hypothetical protein